MHRGVASGRTHPWKSMLTDSLERFACPGGRPGNRCDLGGCEQAQRLHQVQAQFVDAVRLPNFSHGLKTTHCNPIAKPPSKTPACDWVPTTPSQHPPVPALVRAGSR